MSVFYNNALIGAGGAASYQISRSLRFNQPDSASLSRTFGTPTSQNIFTFSTWIKRSRLGTAQRIFAAGTSNLRFDGSSNTLAVDYGATSVFFGVRVFRDPGAWFHLVWSVNGTSGQFYVNGAATESYTGTNTAFNTAIQHEIAASGGSGYLAGYLADIHFIDGQALTPTSFGEFDTNNVWQPKAYSGTYGANGFRLDFSDNSAATATTLGKDRAGSNNWTPNNLSVTAGVGNDSLTDTPTNYGIDTGAGGEVRGNYATLNPLSTVTTVTLANGNLDHSSATTGQNAIASIGVSTGKWYWEVITTAGTTQTRVGVYGTAASSLYSLAADNTVYGIRFDADAGTLDRTSDGTNWTSIATGLTSGPYFPYFNNNGTTAKTVSVNFGQRAFTYTAPSGYKALCTQNLPTPNITNGATAMDAVLYTGTGSSLTPTSTLGFSPDLVWIKSRSAATDNTLYDSVRGVQSRLESNNQDAQVTSDNGLTAFNSNGFTLGTLAQVNTNTATYVGWCWNESASSGFDIVTYTGNGTAGTTVAHSLGVKPSLMIVKQLSAAGTNWTVYHTSTGATKFLALQSIAAAVSQTNKWNDTEPTSTVFTLGSGSDTNQNTQTYVGYLWASVSGYSAFGSYSGNANADGPFIYLGFRPKWILLKRTESTGNWTIIDTAREGYNVDNDPLYPNLADAEGTTDLVDIVSNGFKLRSTDISVNGGTGTYAYACFAEHPFALARAR